MDLVRLEYIFRNLSGPLVFQSDSSLCIAKILDELEVVHLEFLRVEKLKHGPLSMLMRFEQFILLLCFLLFVDPITLDEHVKPLLREFILQLQLVEQEMF